MKGKLPHQELITQDTDNRRSSGKMGVSCPDGCGKQAVGQTQSNQRNDKDSHMAESVTRHALNPPVEKFQFLLDGYTAGESSNPTNSLPEKDEQDQYVLRVVESGRESAQGYPALSYTLPLNGRAVIRER